MGRRGGGTCAGLAQRRSESHPNLQLPFLPVSGSSSTVYHLRRSIISVISIAYVRGCQPYTCDMCNMLLPACAWQLRWCVPACRQQPPAGPRGPRRVPSVQWLRQRGVQLGLRGSMPKPRHASPCRCCRRAMRCAQPTRSRGLTYHRCSPMGCNWQRFIMATTRSDRPYVQPEAPHPARMYCTHTVSRCAANPSAFTHINPRTRYTPRPYLTCPLHP